MHYVLAPTPPTEHPLVGFIRTLDPPSEEPSATTRRAGGGGGGATTVRSRG